MPYQLHTPALPPVDELDELELLDEVLEPPTMPPLPDCDSQVVAPMQLALFS